MPAIADRAVWEKIAKGRAGVRWDNVVENILKGYGGEQEDTLSIEKFGGYKTEVKERMEQRERLELRNWEKVERRVEIYRELREYI